PPKQAPPPAVLGDPPRRPRGPRPRHPRGAPGERRRGPARTGPPRHRLCALWSGALLLRQSVGRAGRTAGGAAPALPGLLRLAAREVPPGRRGRPGRGADLALSGP